MPVAPICPGYAGALDVLANYWFKRIELIDAREASPPETNLEMSAEAALACCLKPHGFTDEQSCVEAMFEDGFSLGIRVAAILARRPFDAEAPLRRLMDDFLAVLRDRRLDAAGGVAQ